MHLFKRLAVLLFLFPVMALAQSGISGVVRDVQGSVISGVTVQAASDALIEKSRTATTNGAGEYKIIDLRPGTYTVTFIMPGFSKVEQSNVVLTADFVANINADLKVGGADETVQVTAESVGLDIQTTTQQAVLTRQVMDNVPTGHSVFSDGQTQPGVSLSKPDVGGSTGMQQGTIQVHGSQTNDVAFMIDDMPVNSNYTTGGSVGVYYNDGMIQETSYKTSAIPAQYSQGGIVINMVPKEGGNQFHGSFYGSGMSSGTQFNNVPSNNPFLKAGNNFQSMYDLNGSLGGPILKDKLWFFSTVRRWTVNEYQANIFNPSGAQGLEDQRITSGVGRLTWQINEKNKVSGYYDKNMKYRGHRHDTSTSVPSISDEAAVIQATPLGYTSQFKWTSTLSSKLLLEAGLSLFFLDYTYSNEPESNPSAVATITNGVLSNVAQYTYRSQANRRSYVGNVSYVTGSHNWKFGAIYGGAPYRETYATQGDATVTITGTNSPVINFYNTPIDTRENLNADFGLYAQDSWTIKHRLTLNLGVRYEFLNASLLHQSAPAGRFVQARDFAPVSSLPSWNNVVPRIGMAWDPTGSGKTVIKASASMYDQIMAVYIAQLFTPMQRASKSCTWAHPTTPISSATLNTNGITLVQAAYSSHYPTPGLPGDQLANCTPSDQYSFSGTNNQKTDLKRPYSWEYSLGVQREVIPRLVVSATGYYRTNRNNIGLKNTAEPLAGYTQTTRVTPVIGGYPELSNQTITVYSAPGTASTNTLSNYRELNSQYVGLEFTGRYSFAGQNFLSIAYTVGKKTGSNLGTTSDLNNPNNLKNSYGPIELDSTNQFRLTGVYMLPLKFKISGNYIHNTGIPLNPTYTVSGLTQGSATVLLAKIGTYRYPSVDLMDIRFGRVFKIEHFSLEPFFDMYNLFNKNTTTTANTSVNTQTSTVVPQNFRGVTQNLEPRLVRIGLKFDF